MDFLAFRPNFQKATLENEGGGVFVMEEARLKIQFNEEKNKFKLDADGQSFEFTKE